jgi:hypothetical protein
MFVTKIDGIFLKFGNFWLSGVREADVSHANSDSEKCGFTWTLFSGIGSFEWRHLSTNWNNDALDLSGHTAERSPVHAVFLTSNFSSADCTVSSPSKRAV